MKEAISQTPLNEVQLHLLKVFSFTKNEEDLKELQTVLFTHYRNKLDIQAGEFWKRNHLDSAKMGKSCTDTTILRQNENCFRYLFI